MDVELDEVDGDDEDEPIDDGEFVLCCCCVCNSNACFLFLGSLVDLLADASRLACLEVCTGDSCCWYIEVCVGDRSEEVDEADDELEQVEVESLFDSARAAAAANRSRSHLNRFCRLK